jgi:hypothetical protein
MQMQRGLFVCSPLRGPGIRQWIFFSRLFSSILDWRLWRPSPLADSRSWSWSLTAARKKSSVESRLELSNGLQ